MLTPDIQCWTFVWENANKRNKINIIISKDLLMIGMVKLNTSYIYIWQEVQ